MRYVRIFLSIPHVFFCQFPMPAKRRNSVCSRHSKIKAQTPQKNQTSPTETSQLDTPPITYPHDLYTNNVAPPPLIMLLLWYVVVCGADALITALTTCVYGRVADARHMKHTMDCIIDLHQQPVRFCHRPYTIVTVESNANGLQRCPNYYYYCYHIYYFICITSAHITYILFSTI